MFVILFFLILLLNMILFPFLSILDIIQNWFMWDDSFLAPHWIQWSFHLQLFSFCAVFTEFLWEFFTARLNYTYFSQGQEFGDVLKSGPGENATVEKQGCHPFYESLIDDPYVAEVSYSYRTPQGFFSDVLSKWKYRVFYYDLKFYAIVGKIPN